MLINSTKDTPSVFLSEEECKFEIKGPSYSKDVIVIYDKVLDWIISVIPKLTCELNCIFDFEILSSISEKRILFLISELDKQFLKGKKIKITWHTSDDEDSIDFAEDLRILFKLPIETAN